MNFLEKNEFLFLMILLFSETYSRYYNYPTAIVLNNQNVFIIHQTGIIIYDPSLFIKVKNVYNFNDNETITNENEYSKVSISKFDDGYIVSVIIDKIYIFDNEGNLKNKYDFFTFEEDLYFTLAVHKVDNMNYHYYLIGYIYDHKLNLYYYKYDSSKNENILIKSLENFKDIYSHNYYGILNKGITCQFIIVNSTDIISCYYYVYIESHHQMTITNFYINDTLIDYKNNFHYEVSESIGCFKSSVNPEHTKFITCLYYSSSGNIQCYIYDARSY